MKTILKISVEYLVESDTKEHLNDMCNQIQCNYENIDIPCNDDSYKSWQIEKMSSEIKIKTVEKEE